MVSLGASRLASLPRDGLKPQPACLRQCWIANRPSRWQLRARLNNSEEQQGGLDPKLEVAVPSNQRPVNELAQLRDGQLYSWVSLQHMVVQQ